MSSPHPRNGQRPSRRNRELNGRVVASKPHVAPVDGGVMEWQSGSLRMTPALTPPATTSGRGWIGKKLRERPKPGSATFRGGPLLTGAHAHQYFRLFDCPHKVTPGNFVEPPPRRRGMNRMSRSRRSYPPGPRSRRGIPLRIVAGRPGSYSEAFWRSKGFWRRACAPESAARVRQIHGVDRATSPPSRLRRPSPCLR